MTTSYLGCSCWSSLKCTVYQRRSAKLWNSDLIFYFFLRWHWCPWSTILPGGGTQFFLICKFSNAVTSIVLKTFWSSRATHCCPAGIFSATILELETSFDWHIPRSIAGYRVAQVDTLHGDTHIGLIGFLNILTNITQEFIYSDYGCENFEVL